MIIAPRNRTSGMPCSRVNFITADRAMLCYFPTMRSVNRTTGTGTHAVRDNWLRAYARFLASRQESTMLKAAPLALMGILPAEILTNAIPVLGVADDVSYVVLAVYIALRTLARVRRYR
jgi:uncharacterized membrane protein YkvA (DUF1232 family)